MHQPAASTTPTVQPEPREAIRKPRSAFESFALREPAAAAWIKRAMESFEFARAMYDAVLRYGHLTDRQMDAIKRCMDREAQKLGGQDDKAPTVTVGEIERAFASALGNGVKNPKLRLDAFIFSPAKSTGANPGAIYVKDGQGAYLGKVLGGRFYRSRECSTESENAIVSVSSNPHDAAIAYGMRTGNCAVCNRPLTKGESLDIGIGPICLERMGWK